MLYPLITFGLSDAVLVAVGGWLVLRKTTRREGLPANTTRLEESRSGRGTAPGGRRGVPRPGAVALDRRPGNRTGTGPWCGQCDLTVDRPPATRISRSRIFRR